MLRRRHTTLLKIVIGIAIVYFGSFLIFDRPFLNFSEFESFRVQKELLNEKQLAIEKIRPLLDAGLVVAKWNGDKEDPAVPGGPGKTQLEHKSLVSFV